MAESNREEIAKLEALYANNPGGRVFTHLAEAYRKAGELERARQILEDGITRHAEYASAHVVLGRVLQDQGARADASAAFRRVLELDPENRVALRSLGDLAREGNNRAEALAYFRQLLSLDPTDDQLVRIIDQLNAAVHAAETEAGAEPSLDEIAPQSPEVNPRATGTHEPEITSSAGHHFSRTEELTDSDAKAEDAAAASDPDASQPFVVESFVPVSNDDIEDYVTPDIRLDWDSEGVPHGESPTLPGDLAAFAQADAAESATEAEPGAFASEAAAEGETTGEDAERGTSDAESEAAPAEPATWAAIETTPAWADAAATAESDPAEAFEPAALSSDEETADEETARFEQPDPIEQSEPDAVAPEPVAEVFEEATLEVSEFVDLGEEPLVTEHEPTFEELLSSSRAEGWESQQAAEPTSLQSELQTETLAELYLRQGFNDRAAEVYRSLLERNPGDERLRRRLEEVEAQLTEERAAGGFAAAETSWHDHEDSAPDTFWTGGGEDASFEPTLYAWSPDAEAEEPTGPTIGSYFSDLLSWRPSGRNGSVAVENTATLTSAAEHVSAFVEAAPAAKEGGDPATATEEVPPEVGGPGESAFEEVEAPKDRDAFVAQEFVGAPESSAAEVSTEPDYSVAPDSHAAPEPQSAPEREAAAEASSAPAAPEPPASVPAALPSAMLSQFSAPLNEVEAAFEEWFSGAPGQPASAAPAAQPEKPAPAAPDPVASATPVETRPPAAPSSEESEDDEDLEMFRSWLQSLKR